MAGWWMDLGGCHPLPISSYRHLLAIPSPASLLSRSLSRRLVRPAVSDTNETNEPKRPSRTMELRQNGGQWQYRLSVFGQVRVDWQYAGETRESAIAEVKDRFGADYLPVG